MVEDITGRNTTLFHYGDTENKCDDNIVLSFYIYLNNLLSYLIFLCIT